MIRPLIAGVAVLLSIAAAPATQPATQPTHLRVTVWRTVDGRTAESTEVVVAVGSPGATVVTVGGTTLTVDQVRPVEHGDCHLRVVYAEVDTDGRTGNVTSTNVATTLAWPLDKRARLGATHRGGEISLRVSAAADPTTQP